MAPPSYAVVQFTATEGGTVAIVNEKWLTPRRCEVFWPPVKGSKAFDRFLEDTKVSPDVEKWKLYTIQRVFCETDSLAKAKKKLNLAEYNSDLQTDTDIECENLPKRKSTRNKRFISSDEEYDDDKYLRPPPLKKKFVLELEDAENVTQNSAKQQGTPKSSSSGLEDVNKSDCNLSTPKSSLPAVYNDVNLNAAETQVTPKSSMKQELLSPRTELSTFFFKNEALTPKSLQTFNEKLDSSTTLSIGNEESQQRKPELTGFEEKVIGLLSQIKTQNETIISFLGNNNTETALKKEFKFPIKSLDDLFCIEQLLSSEDNKANLVSYLKTIGGRELAYKTSRVMRIVLSDALASKFNYFGKRSNKKAFSELKLCAAIIEAIKDATTGTGATLKAVEDSIKTWLKHAPERERKAQTKFVPS